VAAWNLISDETSSRCELVNVQKIIIKRVKFVTSIKIPTANSESLNLIER